MVMPYKDEITREIVEKTRTPLVVIDRRFDDIAMNSVTLNDRQGGYIATKYLLDRGHRQIGFASPGYLRDSSVLTDRHDGYVDALRERGIEPNPAWLFENFQQIEGGKDLGGRLIGMANRPTAIVCTEDIMACGVIQRLVRAGWSLPRDLSIVGFDDSAPAEFITPALTSVRQDMLLKAKKAFEMVLEAIRDDGDDRCINRVCELEVTITERNSVATL